MGDARKTQSCRMVIGKGLTIFSCRSDERRLAIVLVMGLEVRHSVKLSVSLHVGPLLDQLLVLVLGL